MPRTHCDFSGLATGMSNVAQKDLVGIGRRAGMGQARPRYHQNVNKYPGPNSLEIGLSKRKQLYRVSEGAVET